MKESRILIESIDVDGRNNPLGIDNKTPVFHYTFFSSQNDKRVTSVQVCVKRGESVVWDSGKQPFSGWPYTSYAGEPLSAMTCYSVQIRVWDEKDCPGVWSEPTWFETALLDEGFTAEWIEPEQESAIFEKDIPHFMVFKSNPEHSGNHAHCRPAINIVRDFYLGKDVVRGRIYMSAHGIYELFVNGSKVGRASLAPEISTYQTYLYYQTYDITDMLHTGKNRIAITVADGWWTGRIGLIGGSCQYGERLGLILQAEIAFADGERMRICSDEKFVSSPSGTLCADLFMGEIRDNTKEPTEWKDPGFTLNSWTKCRRTCYGKGNLIAQPIDPVEDYQIFEPSAWLNTPCGECVVDFGQVISGVVELTVDGTSGQTVKLDYCEVLDKEGNYFRNITGRNKDQTDTLICRQGRQIWRPSFTYHGFRYVRIQGVARSQIGKIRAIMLATKLNSSGEFHCAHAELSQLQHNIVQSEIGNMLSIPTDCPQREKTGWTGDIQIFAKTGAFNFDLRNFLSVWLMNLRAEQKQDGAIPLIVPNFPLQEKMLLQITGGYGTSSGWSDACVLLPWYLYQCYGQIEILQDNFECMSAYLGYVKNQAKIRPDHCGDLSVEQEMRNPYLWNGGYHYGDWLIPSLLRQPDGIALGRSETKSIVGSCWYAITLEAYLNICNALKERSGWEVNREICETESLLQNVRTAIREEYVCPDGTLVGRQLQGPYVMVLQSGAVEGDLKAKVANRLVQLIHQSDDCLDTGFSSVSFLLDVLTENGYKDLAYTLLFQTKSPSWLYMVKQGATTVWENWEAITPEGEPTVCSYNHYAYGCVGDWIYREIGGLQLGEPGYRHIIFAPDVNRGIDSANTSYMTPYGKASCHWEKRKEECHIKVEIPIGATGELQLGKYVTQLTSGEHKLMVRLSEG